jgi:hypothetical protein
MSYTEIYSFGKDGNAYSYEDVKNAFRGAMAVWGFLEEKYLSDYRPSFVPVNIPDSKIEQYLHYKPTRVSSASDDNAMKEIWALFRDERLLKEERIVLGTTFDNVLVKKENIQEVIDAFYKFEGETSLKEQADILKELINDGDTIAIGWNQTSVCEGWTSKGLYDEENEETATYNLFKQKDHWFLFDELK